ncbi:hypothetical protein [Streptomyces chrestomyceticus]|uniref:hypothetical protein n=1 Tax=Streptomyces chrestomyceticus TaxID=68185 RepID=UPI0039E00ABB
MDEAFVQLRNHACSQRRKPTDVAAQVAYPQSLRRKAVAGAICPPPPVGRAGQGASQAPSPPDPPCPRIRRVTGSPGNRPGRVERVDPLREVPVLRDRQPLAVRHALALQLRRDRR